MNELKPLWESAQRAVIVGDAPALECLLRENPQLMTQTPPAFVPSGPGPHYAGAARSMIVREHQFRSFDEFEEHLEAMNRKDLPVAQFEAAVEAVITGDVASLQRLLQARPELIRARSMRTHHATLLHYLGANGVEGWRQKTPGNAVQVAETLLQAGAKVDATADMYGGGATTLGLVATSIHPWLAGVVDALMETLLKAGAVIGGPSAVNGCLANGRPWAAEFLAQRGAPLDLEGAAGVGRIDLVQAFFDEGGGLKANATPAQMRDGFAWACEFGRTGVVDFLLRRGIAVDARLRHHGQTGLHWAAYGAHADTVKLLLERKAPVEAKDESFDGTPLGWALYGWGESVPGATRDAYDEVVALLVDAGGKAEPDWLADRGLDEKLRADARMLAAFRGETLAR